MACKRAAHYAGFSAGCDVRGTREPQRQASRYQCHHHVERGDVLHDQLFFMKRCGIDAYAVRADKDIEAALAGLSTFSDAYQAAVDQPQPLFRRRAA